MAVPGDWDFESANWRLAPASFPSPPTVLRLPLSAPGYDNLAVLCKQAESLVLPQGRLVTYLRYYPDAWCHVCFRNQAADGSANRLNTYHFHIYPGNCKFVRRVAGVDTVLDTWAAAWATGNTWHLLRVSWWTAYDYQNTPSLAMRIERYTAGAWVEDNTVYDPVDMWAASGVNRCGLWGEWGGAAYTYWDDTEIWKPTP